MGLVMGHTMAGSMDLTTEEVMVLIQGRIMDPIMATDMVTAGLTGFMVESIIQLVPMCS
jgi:hypothetical protein